MSDFSPEVIRRKQLMLAGGLALLALGGAALYFWAARPAPPPPPEERMRKTLATAGRVDERAAWRAKAEADLSNLTAESRNTSAIAARLEQENEALRGQVAAMARNGLTAPPPMPVPSFSRETHTQAELPPAPPVASRAAAMSTPLDANSFLSRAVAGDAPSAAKPTAPAVAAVPVPKGIVTLTWAAPAVPQAQARSRDEKGVGTYLPTGSFVRADLLTGLYAPTGGQAQKNPLPVLLRLKDNAFLPSRMRAGIKDCFVTGAAFGDQSAERAYIRTEKLSCIGADGKAVDSRLSATVVDGDGSIGIRGRLVRKEGAFLQQAIVASLASGLGQAFRSSANTQSVSALGSTSTVQSGEEFRAGFAGGMSNAADRLANYFVSAAEKMHAVVEVNAGREVTVFFTAGMQLDLAQNAIEEDDE